MLLKSKDANPTDFKRPAKITIQNNMQLFKNK